MGQLCKYLSCLYPVDVNIAKKNTPCKYTKCVLHVVSFYVYEIIVTPQRNVQATNNGGRYTSSSQRSKRKLTCTSVPALHCLLCCFSDPLHGLSRKGTVHTG